MPETGPRLPHIWPQAQGEPPAWYALHTKSRHEARVGSRLAQLGLEVFLPWEQVPSRRRDRRRLIQVPLLPGYLFVRSALEPWMHLSLLRTPGVVRLLSQQGRPVPVPPHEIDSLRRLCQLSQALRHAPFRPGQLVRVVSGPLAGVVGSIERVRSGGQRLVVSIQALRRALSVDLPECLLERL